jgi:hypothetical protein
MIQEIIFYSYYNVNFSNGKFFEIISLPSRLSSDLKPGKFWFETKNWYRFIYNEDSKELFDWIDKNFSFSSWEEIDWLCEMPKEIEISLGLNDKQYFVYLGPQVMPEIHNNFCSFSSLAAENLTKINYRYYTELQKLIKQAQNGILKIIFWSKK